MAKQSRDAEKSEVVKSSEEPKPVGGFFGGEISSNQTYGTSTLDLLAVRKLTTAILGGLSNKAAISFYLWVLWAYFGPLALGDINDLVSSSGPLNDEESQALGDLLGAVESTGLTEERVSGSSDLAEFDPATIGILITVTKLVIGLIKKRRGE